MKTLSSALLLLLALPALAGSVHHQMDASLDPVTHRIEVVSRLIVADQRGNISAPETLLFTLHKELVPISRTQGVVIWPQAQSGNLVNEPIFKSYHVSLPAGVSEFTLQYSGTIYHPLSSEEEEYARGFRDTPGIISSEGIYLAGSSYWYPRFSDELVSFSLSVSLPSGWDSVSQGDRVLHERDGAHSRAIWVSAEPQDDIYLIGGEFTEYSRQGTSALAMAFLRTPDAALAEKYLGVTARYIEMYDRLIGAYPFRKFALVENFWETGYGMPSFTLLGPKIIRFPFILHSSYPHEILHNWWGNSVYVDYASGNWCEGLTAYLADHLIKEQGGAGAEYRRETLQKYSNYVTGGNDFPLIEFRERHNPATEAIGYGKSLGVYHMLRRTLGDEAFIEGLRDFYANQKFRRAGFEDFRRSMERASGRSLDAEFEQWVRQAGAPELRVAGKPSARRLGGSDEFELTFALEQLQSGRIFRLEVPVAVDIQGSEHAFQVTVPMDRHQESIRLRVPGRPLRVHVDPEFDVFRRLHPLEVPPTLSRALGAEKQLVVIPSRASSTMRQAYLELAALWSVGKHGVSGKEIRLDSELDQLPKDRTVWILGWENLWAKQALDALAPFGVSPTQRGVRLDDLEFVREDHAFVATVPNPGNAAEVIGWVALGERQGVAGTMAVGRKLPHYGKYGYLGFEGLDARNIAKGIWPAIHSPMTAPVIVDGRTGDGPRGRLAPRAPLARMPGLFQAEAFRASVDFLTQEELGGRELGSPELDRVAEYLAEKLRANGVEPAGPPGEDGYFQRWEENLPSPKGKTRLTNVVGEIRGKRPELPPVVLGAHYDHLGRGWPDSHAGNRGKIHPGANDNASGVAVLLEVAKAYGERKKAGSLPERTIRFVLFTGEEAGLLGSRRFIQEAGRAFMAIVNLDTVGGLGSGKLQVLGTGSAKEWGSIFRGVEHLSGVPLALIAQDVGGSDQRSFHEAGIPGVQFFTGANADYHRPSDTAERLDYDGMIRVAQVTLETLDYLAWRTEPLTGTTSAPDQPPPGGERKVFLGTVPDFSYPGPGVRIAEVLEGSPAASAGLAAEDLVLKMNETAIGGLREYATVLKGLSPGQEVAILYSRAGVEQVCRAVVTER